MKILLVNIDSSLPNIALHKIEMWHKSRGDEVLWDYPLAASTSDRIYVSCLFPNNMSKVAEYLDFGDKVDVGGTGFSISKTLPQEIEDMKPKINIGFTTRGCIRKCPFCVVPEKEGKLRITGDIYDFWDGKSKRIRILDNTPFGIKEHFLKICGQIAKENLKVSFDGLDARLLDEDIAQWLSQLRHEEYHFAFDNLADEPHVRNAIKLLVKNGIKRSSFYVLIGYNTNVNEDLYRLTILRNMGQNAFVQRYNNKKERIYEALASWANTRHLFQAMTFKQFCEDKRWAHRFTDYFFVREDNLIVLKTKLKE